jgi:hypothetical protein
MNVIVKTHVIILFGFFILCWSVSCQKELHGDNNVIILTPPPPGAIPDSEYLDRIYFIDSAAVEKDTLLFQTYLYDSNRRLLNISYYYYYPTSMGSGLNKSQYFFYNATDTLPFKRAEYDYKEALQYSSQALIDTSVSFFQYNAAGKKRFDSTLETDHNYSNGSNVVEFRKEVSRFTYDGDNVYVQKTSSRLGGTNPIQYIITFTDTGYFDAAGNLTTLKSYGSNVPGMYTLGTFTYDNHPSPFAKLSNFASIDFFKIFEPSWPLLQSRNNPQQVLRNLIGGTSVFYQDYTNRYNYNANGYPLRIVQPVSTTSGNFKLIEFRYRRL